MKTVNKWIAAAFGVMMLTIVVTVVFTFETTDFACKRNFLLPQAAMLGLGMGILTALCGAGHALRHVGRHAYALYGLLLFIMEAGICYFSYFLTDWDVKTILESAYTIAGGHDFYVDHYYYSIYPNNVFLTAVFSVVMRLYRLIVGDAGLDRCVYALIVLQCALNAATGVLLCKIVSRLGHSSGLTRAAGLVYAVFIAVSPWVSIPYSDSMGLIFPISILLCYTHLAEKPGRYGLLIGVLTVLGYLVKPQTAIMAIAVVLLEGLRLLQKRAGMRLLRLLAGAALAVTCIALIPTIVLRMLPIEKREIGSVSVAHYAMMGLNEKSNGCFSASDLSFTLSVPKEERTAANLNAIRERLETMGFSGLLRHEHKKLLSDYADGTFAWGCEGNFYRESIADKDGVLSPLLKSLINSESGQNFPFFAVWLQSVWLGILAAALLGPLVFFRNSETETTQNAFSAAMLALLGLTLFELIFEARARYLFTYAPVYLLVGMLGLQAAFGALRNRCISTKK